MKTIEELERQGKEEAKRIAEKQVNYFRWMVVLLALLLSMIICFELGVLPFDKEVFGILMVIGSLLICLLAVGVVILPDVPFSLLTHNHERRAAMNEQQRRMMEQQRLAQQRLEQQRLEQQRRMEQQRLLEQRRMEQQSRQKR